MSDAPKVPYKLVNRLVDSLHVRVSRNRLPSEDYRQLRISALEFFQTWKPKDDPMRVSLAGLGSFEVRPESRHYELKFLNPQVCDVRVWRLPVWADAFETGHLYVDFRSVFLQFHGLAGVHKVLAQLVRFFYDEHQVVDVEARLGQHDWERISRVDLAVDTQEPRGMLDEDLDRYVTRARIVEPFSTLTDATVKEAVNAVLRDKKDGSPSQDNKGGDNRREPWARPPPGVVERAASAVLAEYAELVNEARRHDSGGAFVTRKVRRNRKIQTCYFGRFASDLYAIRYNKLASLSVQHKLYMTDIWADNGWDGSSKVWRTEFRITGRMLKRLEPAVTYIADKRGLGVQVDSLQELDQFEQHLELVWQYLTHEWLRHCDIPWDDTNQKETQRWTTSAWWTIVQKAWEPKDNQVQLARRHWRPVDPTDDAKDEQLLAQLKGITVALAARRSSTDQGLPLGVDSATGEVVGGMQSVLNDLQGYMMSNEFYSDLHERRERYGMDDDTDKMLAEVLELGSLDAWESAQYRRERMREGLGS